MMLEWGVSVVAIMLLGFANAVVLCNQPVKSVLSLVACFLCVSVFWLLMGADYLAFLLVFLYVGAVMTLFLFLVIMLNIDHYKPEDCLSFPIQLLVVGCTIVLPLMVYVVVTGGYFPEGHILKPMLQKTISALDVFTEMSLVLYHDYAVLLQLLAMVLVVPVVVATGLVRQGRRPEVKRQDVASQLATTVNDRLTLISNRKRKR
jgi:NADH-quinone oxidoreductase subunit J